MKTLPSILAMFLALSLTAATARAEHRAVHTDVSQVYACAPLGAAGFVAATDGGVALVDAKGRGQAVWTALDGLPGTRARAILHDDSANKGTSEVATAHTLWLGTEHGVARVRIRGNAMKVLETHASAPVHALLFRGDTLYVGTWGSGVLRLQDNRLVPIAFAGAHTAARTRITDLIWFGGELIAATAGSGLYRLEQGRMRPVQDELAGAMIWSLDVYENTLFAGTVDGLYAVQPGRTEQDNSAPGPATRVVGGDVRHVVARSLSGSPAIDIAVFGRGVRRVDARGNELASPGPDAAQYVYSFAQKGQSMCMGGHDGLWLRAGRTWKKAALAGPPSNDISALAVDGARLWVGTFDSGLAVHEAGAWRRVTHPRLDANINALAVAHGRVWVATSAGLSVIRGGDITRLDERDGLPSRHVLSVTALEQGGVLAGTTRGAAIIRDGTVTVIGRKQGIYIANVWAVAEDTDGWIWLGTTKGLYRVGPDASWQRFSVATGHLRDDWVMALARHGDALWIGTYKGGVTRLDRGQEHAYVATHVGPGWVNPGGLTRRGDTLYMATMEGLLVSEGNGLRPAPGAALGRDTTATAVQGQRLWIASRRGLRSVTITP